MKKLRERINSKLTLLKNFELRHPIIPIIYGFLGGIFLIFVVFIGSTLINYVGIDQNIEIVFEDKEFEEEVKQYLHKDSLKKSDLLDVKTLEISNNNKIINIEDVKKFPNLTQLSIYNCQVKDISPIEDLENLQLLDISYNNIYDISCIANCCCLKEVNLTKNHITDILPLCELPGLRELYIASNNIGEVPDEFQKLSKLIILDISANGLCDVSGVNRVPSLIELKLSSNKIITTPDFYNLKNLQILDLSGNALYDYNPTSIMESVIELNLSSNALDNLEFIDKFPSLEKLNVAMNPYNSLLGIEKCKTLESLDIRYTNITDVMMLQSLPNFNTIYVNDNFDHGKLDFMIGNFRNADKVTKDYLLEKQYDLIEDE